jgi:hypothetical protein
MEYNFNLCKVREALGRRNGGTLTCAGGFCGHD